MSSERCRHRRHRRKPTVGRKKKMKIIQNRYDINSWALQCPHFSLCSYTRKNNENDEVITILYQLYRHRWLQCGRCWRSRSNYGKDDVNSIMCRQCQHCNVEKKLRQLNKIGEVVVGFGFIRIICYFRRKKKKWRNVVSCRSHNIVSC